MCGAVGLCFGPASFRICALFQSLSGVAVVTFLHVLDCPQFYWWLMFELHCAKTLCLHGTDFFQASAILCRQFFSKKKKKRHSGRGILFLVETAVQTGIDSKSWSLYLGNFWALMLQQYIISWRLHCWTSSKWGVLFGSGQYVIRSEVFWFCLFLKNAFCANTNLVTKLRWKRFSIKIELIKIASSEVQNCQNCRWLYWLFVVRG